MTAVTTPDPVSLALAVKRGALKLASIPDAQRPLVQAVLQRMSDAQAGQIAQRAEVKRPWRTRG